MIFQDLGVQEEYYIYECYDSSSAPAYLVIFICTYLALLQVIGIILAFQTRKVKIPVLNDSKFVAVLIYMSSIVLVVLFLCTLLLNGYVNARAAIYCGGILIMAVAFLLLMFIPKVQGSCLPMWFRSAACWSVLLVIRSTSCQRRQRSVQLYKTSACTLL